jgi:acetoin utilization protein AcuB
MSKAIPSVAKYMTTQPQTIGADISIAKAEKMMSEQRIRHLPVLRAGRLVGILSDRDVKMVMTFKDVDPEKVLVEDAYTPDPYITSPEARLDEVAEKMAAHKYSCVLVEDNRKLVGILTWVDALQAMSEILKQRFH